MKKFKGFTLIELMIVVAILGVLMAVAIPSYYNFVKQASAEACLSESKNYANHVYYQYYSEDKHVGLPSPQYGVCLEITDASNWNESTTDLVIHAKSKYSKKIDIECDFKDGVSCSLLP